MELLPYSSAIFVFLMVILVGYVAYKIFIKKDRPDNSYTPFDYITGQTEDEFHDEQEEHEEDKNKHL